MSLYRSALAGVILAILVQAAAAHLISGGVGGAPPAPTITSVTVTPGTFVGGSPNGTSTGAIAVTLSSGSFTGTLAIAVGGQGTDFTLSSSTLPSNLLLNGTQAAGTYTVNIVPTQAGLGNSGASFPVTITGTQAQQIASITPTSCSFTAGVQNGTICNLSVTMSPTSPASTAGLTLSGANSGAFHLVGAGCSNISSGTCTIEQSASSIGTAAGTYTDISAVATQGGIGNSPFTQALTLTGTGAPTITSIGSTNSSFVAQAGNAGTTIGTLSASVSSGSFGGTFTIDTQAGCVGANNTSFTISGTTLKIGASDITTAGTYSVSVLATDGSFGNSPKCMVLNLTGSTPGGGVTTFTFQNDTGASLSPGAPVSFGQAFRYGDIGAGNHPDIRDASSGTSMPGQQWDEIATFHENGGNSSWRHAVWAIWLPATSPQYTGGVLPAGATFQVEFVSTAGTYSQSSHQALSVLCSGGAAHNLKIHLTDVRNQDDTVRDSGDATFTVCNNISNAGRDAPRHLRAGNVYDEYEVSGMFVYTSGHQDPLLYAQCILDIFTQASNGTSPGDVRWMCHLHNSWQNVAAGASGNVGNPGPVGFANDPQAISYRPEIDDGASDVLDWSNLDATVTSASNPIVTASAAGCNASGETVCLDIPGSTGANTWYQGQATRVSCSGTCTGGLNNGQLYYIYPSGTTSTRTSSGSQYVSLITDPFYNGSFPMTLSQGTATTTFSTRVQHYTREAWQTLDWTGLTNWSPFGTTTRVTRKVYPAFTAAEARYWQESGLVIPLNLSQPTAQLGPDYSNGLGTNFEPMGRLNVIGGAGTGTRPDLGITNEWANKAFITQAAADWDLARLFTLGTSMHGYSTLLDESTGHISALNNGPPTGPGGNGNGAAYAGLGPLRNQTTWLGLVLGGPSFDSGIAEPDRTLPPGAIYDISGGTLNGGTGNDHMPSFDGFTYMVFGDRHFLDLMQWQGERGFLQQRVGPGPELGQGYYRDNNAVFPGDGNTYHYFGLTTVCCQGRGSAWLTRDVVNPATFGQDPNVAYPGGTFNSERQYFNDMVTETSNYWPLFLAYMDGPGSTGYSASIYPPGQPDPATAGILSDTFTMGYISSVTYIMTTFLHVPVAQTWNSQLQRFYEGVLGGQLPGAPVSYYAIDFNLEPQVHDGSAHQTGFGGNVGQYMNGTDASDFGGWDESPGMNILAGGQMQTGCCYTYTAGDTLKMMYNGWLGVQAPSPVDQLPGNRWFTIMAPVDNSAHTFYIQCTSADHAAYPTQCPTAGGPFTSFTRGGVALAIPENGHWPKFRMQFDPGPNQSYIDPNYSQYGGQTINGLAILGYNVSHATSDFNTRCGPLPNGADCYNPALLSNWWDPTIVVPGLPTAVNTVVSSGQTINPITPASCSFTAGTPNGAICNVNVTMSPSSPASTAALTLTGANSGGFQLSGTGCSNVSLGACAITQSSGGTLAGTYTDLAVVATQSGISNSPVTQSLTLTGTGGTTTLLPTPPGGFHWVQTFGDEFNSAFNTAVWDVDHFGGSPNATATTNNGILTITIETSSPDTRTIIDTWTTSGGTGNHAFSQRYGYFVYDIKLPTYSSGEYDVEFFGRDNWTGGGLSVGKYAEMAIASGKNENNYRTLRPYQADGNASFSFMTDPDVGVDVTLAYHQYGILWVNDATAHGTVTMYFDGTPFSGPTALLSAGWDVGMFFDLYWSPEQAGNTLGGSNGIPDFGSIMQVDWVRAYQLAPN